MAGPGGNERGRISIRAVPSTAGFPRELRTQLQGVEQRQKIRIGVVLDRRGLPEEVRAVAGAVESGAKIRVPATIDPSGMRREAAVAAEVASGQSVMFRAVLDRDSIPSMSVLLGRLLGSGARNLITLGVQVRGVRQSYAAIGSLLAIIGRLTAGLAAAGAAGTALQVLTAAALGLGAALGQAVGSIGLLPGIVAGAGVAISTLVVGFQGIGDAISSAGDPAKFAEALANLAPNAAATAVAFKQLGPAFSDLRLDVQNALFAGMAEQISRLAGQYLPVLRTGMTGVAGSLNQAAGQVAAFAGSAQTVADTGTLFGNVQRAIAAITPAIAPVLAGFRDLGVVGSTVVADLSGGLANAGQRFGAFMAQARESGALEQFLRNAVATLQTFGSILGNIGSIIGSVFSAGAATGQSLLGVLDRATESLATFLQSAAGQSALASFFQTASAGAQTLMQVFTALQPAIAPLLSVVSTLAQSAFGALASILTALAPVVTQLANALQPVAQQLGGVLLQAAQQLGPPLANIASVVGQVLLTALNALTPVLPVIVGALTQLATIVGGLLTTALQTLSPIFPVITTALAQIAPLVPLIATAFGQLVSALLPLLPPLIQLAAAIIPPLVSILQALIPPIVSIVNAALSLLVPALNAIIGVVTAVVNFVSPAISGLANLVGGHFRNIAETATAVWNAIKQTVTSTVQAVVNFFRGAWDIAVNLVNSAWERIKGAVTGGIGGVIDLVIGLPGDILKALGDLGSLLFNAGKDIILGLINGLKNAAGAVIDFFKNMISDAIDSVLGFLGIGSPSRVFMRIGQDTAEGFAVGIQDGAPLAASAARDLAGAVMFTPPGNASLGGRGGNTINVFPRAEQSEWSIATQVDRTLAFVGRI